jgi:MFS family permease
MGFISGAYYLGIPIGAGLSFIIAGHLGPIIGWRMCFYILGGIGLFFALVMFFIKETPRKIISGAQIEQKPKFKQIRRDLYKALKDSPALTLCIYGGVVFHLVLGSAVYDQVWYVQERGFARAEIAQYTGYIVVVFGIIGNLFGGIGSDWFTEKFNLGRPMFLFWLLLFLLPFNILGRLVWPDNPMFWISMMLGSFQLGAIYGPTFSTVQELAPPHIKATVIAFFILNLNMIGMFLGTTVSGIVIDYLISINVSEPYTKTLLSFTLISALSIPLFWLSGKKYKR